MTIKPVLPNQKTNEKSKEHSNNHSQVDQQVTNASGNHRTNHNLASSNESYSQSPQRRSDVFEDITSRHRRSPHKSSRQKRANDHLHSAKRLNENREKKSSASSIPSTTAHYHDARLSPHHSHSSVTSQVVAGVVPVGTKSPKHNSCVVANTVSVVSTTSQLLLQQSTSGSSGVKCQLSPRSQGANKNSNIGNITTANQQNELFKQLEETLNGYNSGDEWLVPKEGMLTADEWSKRDEQFELSMKQQGLIVHAVEEDGACLFRAISLQIYGDQEMHDFIRQQTMDYIYQNSEYFAQFVTEDINSYVKRKRNINSHGNHIEIQAMSELYNRPVELYCYQTTPINIFNSEQISNGSYPLRLSYQRGSHYNAIIDPYNASVGVGLGLAGYKPESQTREAMRLSEQLEIEQTMFEDKLKTTDWEATNEELQEQVARESYLQWCRENILKNNRIQEDDDGGGGVEGQEQQQRKSAMTGKIGQSSSNSTITSSEAKKLIHQKSNQQQQQTVPVVSSVNSKTFADSCYINTIKTTTSTTKTKLNELNEKQTLWNAGNNNKDNNNKNNNNNNEKDEDVSDNDKISNTSSEGNKNIGNSSLKLFNSSSSSSSSTSINNSNSVNCSGSGCYNNITNGSNPIYRNSIFHMKNSKDVTNINNELQQSTDGAEYCDSDDTDMSSTSTCTIDPIQHQQRLKKTCDKPPTNNVTFCNKRKISITKRLKRRHKEISRGNTWIQEYDLEKSPVKQVLSKKLKIEETDDCNKLKNATEDNPLYDYGAKQENKCSEKTTLENPEFLDKYRLQSKSAAFLQNELNYETKQPSTSKHRPDDGIISSFYQSLLESSYTDDGFGQLTENEMIQKAIEMSRIDYFKNRKLKYDYFHRVHQQDNDDDST